MNIPVYERGNFYVMSNYTFPILEPPFSCENSTTSACYMNISEDKCFKKCDENAYCDYFYHIGNPPFTSVCMQYSQVPLTDIYKYQPYNVVARDSIPFMKDNRINTVVAYKKSAWDLEFGADLSNIIFFGDKFSLKINNKYARLKPIVQDSNVAEFTTDFVDNISSSDSFGVLQLYQRTNTLEKPLTFNDYFTLVMDDTNLTFNKFKWEQTEEPLNENSFIMYCQPISETKDHNVYFSQPIYIHLKDDSYLGLKDGAFNSFPKLGVNGVQYIFSLEVKDKKNKLIFIKSSMPRYIGLIILILLGILFFIIVFFIIFRAYHIKK